jgi:hypothetical protein
MIPVCFNRTIRMAIYSPVPVAYAARLVTAGLCDQGPNVKLVRMAFVRIVTEIDAYLARLHRARELLLAPTVEGPGDITPLTGKRVKLRKPVPAVQSSTRVKEIKSQSGRRPPKQRMGEERSDSASPAVITARAARVPEQPLISAATLPSVQIGETERGSSDELRPPIVSTGRQRSPGNFGTKQKIVPAPALASPTASRIVVVSAERVRQERDRAAQSPIRPPRVPAGGRTGKKAFEALFRD